MDNALHTRLIRDLQDQHPEVKTSGFWDALRKLPEATYMSEMFEFEKDWVASVRFVPDAWTIDYETKHVFIFEVVSTNDITDSKFAKMVELSWALDEDYYTLALTRVDRFGRAAFSPHTISLINEIVNGPTNRKLDKGIIPNWQDLDVALCQEFLDQAQGAAQ